MFCMKKAELRSIYKDKRRALLASERARYDRLILEQTQQFDWSNTAYVHCYLPIAEQREFDTWPLISWLWTHYPAIQTVVSRSDFTTHTLSHYRFGPETPIIKNAWGIPEPSSGDPVSEKVLDVVLVPLLAVDVLGNRIGYGKGFYDRFLNACRPEVTKIGISYFPPVEKIEDVGEWDIPVDGLFSPQGTFWFKNPY